MFDSLKNYISREFIFPKVVIPASDDLKDFVAIVTGASRGVGKAVTETILKKGGTVVAVSRDLEKLQAAFPGTNDSVLLCAGDVSSEKDVKKIIEQTITRFGRVDVVVNNAGINTKKPLENTTVSEFDEMINTNLKGAFLMSKYVIPHMKEARRGLILNIGSKISHNTNIAPNKVLYATTKYGLEGFSFALNRELKPFGIRVSCLMPGTVNTFVSTSTKQYLSPYHIAEIASMIIRFDDIDFESMVIKSKNQNI